MNIQFFVSLSWAQLQVTSSSPRCLKIDAALSSLLRWWSVIISGVPSLLHMRLLTHINIADVPPPWDRYRHDDSSAVD